MQYRTKEHDQKQQPKSMLPDEDYYHRPRTCEKCEGVMIFQGVGEYKCEECRHVMYDDYGKVRMYIEQHPGTTAAQIEEAIGVRQKTIRQMLRDAKIQVASESRCFIACELCRKPIRYGRFCPECERKYHQEIENQIRKENFEKRMRKSRGYGMHIPQENSGTMRYMQTKK